MRQRGQATGSYGLFSLRSIVLLQLVIAIGCSTIAIRLQSAERQFAREQSIHRSLLAAGFGIRTQPTSDPIVRLCRPAYAQRIYCVSIPDVECMSISNECFVELLKGCKELSLISGTAPGGQPADFGTFTGNVNYWSEKLPRTSIVVRYL